MINLRSLEIFYWAAYLSSFSRAAEKLNTTQPTVSQRISALEEQFGRQFINRASKPVSLTPDGQILLQHAELILRQVSKLEKEFDAQNRVRQTIRLGVSETIVQTWLSRFLETSHQRFPNIDFEITVDITSSMMAALQDGELDLTFMLGPANVEGMACHHLINYPLRFYAAPGLVPDNLLGVDQVGLRPILTYPRNAYPYSHLRELLFRMTDTRPRIFTNSSLSTIERMAIDRIGIALVAQGAFSPSLERKRLVALESEIELPPLRFFAFYLLGVGADVLEELVRIATDVAASAALSDF
ncbi:LysR family transcriptional regulator [Xanthobacter aminoxidans]|jgi:DNA-binding transcriptional LysR family regulator|uniref:LysR family transcriptional regulator n=1 Tax=Xanthobacter aminoxidans TaxID=186280 RepID=UPI0037273BBD